MIEYEDYAPQGIITKLRTTRTDLIARDVMAEAAYRIESDVRRIRELESRLRYEERYNDDLAALCDALAAQILAEHDRNVVEDYELRRKPEPIHVDNIDGHAATDWLREHDAALIEELAEKYEQTPERERTYFPKIVGNWLRARAAEKREEH